MNIFKIAILLLLIPIITASAPHKFYVSITKIEYVKDKNSIQIITKIFTDDIETALKKRYSSTISIGTKKETEKDTDFLKKYILEKLSISVNGKPATLKYLGQEYETDMVDAYIEITDVKSFETIEIKNLILFDTYEEQQNIIHLKTKNSRRSIILDKDTTKGSINFE